MCGRYTFHKRFDPTTGLTYEEWVDERDRRYRDADIDAGLRLPRYNIAPSQRVLIADRDAEDAWTAPPATWGFRPHWLPADRKAPINARAETVTDKPMFRGPSARGGA